MTLRRYKAGIRYDAVDVADPEAAKNQLIHAIVDHRQRDRWMGKRDIIHVPIGDPVGSLGEPPLNVRPMFGFLEGNDELGLIEIN